MLHGLPRRSAAIATGVLLTGALSSCGFDYATNRINTISSSVNDREGEIDVLAAAIISGAPDTGVLVATLTNTAEPPEPGVGGTLADDVTTLLEIGGEVAPSEAFDGLEVEPLGIENLYEGGGIAVSGDLDLGGFVEVVMRFDNGQVSTLEVPVVPPCYEYDPDQWPAMELPGPVPEGETEFEAETEAGSGTDESTSLTDPYSCEPIEPEPFGHHGGEEEGGEEETGAEGIESEDAG